MRKIFAAISAAILSVSLCSCSLGETKMFGSSSDTAEETAEHEAEKVTHEVSNDITIGVIDFDTYNPVLTQSPTVRDVCGFIFEPLFGMDSSMRTIGVLANGYKTGADGKSLTVYLKQGVLCHDGSVLIAPDVVYTVNAIRSSGKNYTQLIEPVSSVWALDNYTVCFEFNRSVPDAVSLLTFPIIKQNSMKTNEFNPVGTGPFYMSGDSLLRFVEHHDKLSVLDKINVRTIPDKDKYISLFNANEIDIATSELIDMTTFMPKSNANVKDVVSNTMVFAGFNTKRKIFSDSRTRLAVSMLIDRESAVSHIYYSRAMASRYAINPQSWLSFETEHKLRADETSATALLAEAGWMTDERGMYFMPGTKATYFTVDILVNGDSEERVKIADNLAKKMKTIGIGASVSECSGNELTSRISALNYDMFIGEKELLPNNDLTSLVGSSDNYFGYANASIDTLLSQLGTVQFEADIRSVSQKLYETVYTEAPIAPICFLKKSVVTGAKIKYGVNPSIEGLVRESENWGVK